MHFELKSHKYKYKQITNIQRWCSLMRPQCDAEH
jgi:hypothetical protein